MPGLGWISQTLAQPAHFIYNIRASRRCRLCWLGAGQEWDRTPAAGNCEHLQAAAATKSIPAHSKHMLSGKAAANSQSETQHKSANMSLSSLPTAGKVIPHVSISTGQTSCLNDLPDMDGSIPGWKPGLYYGADEQCKIAFGSVATACTFADTNVVGRKFVCLAKGSREMFRSQNSGELAGSIFILKGLKVLFLAKLSKCFPSLHHLLPPHKSPVRFAQLGAVVHSWQCWVHPLRVLPWGILFPWIPPASLPWLKSLCLGSTACLIAAIWTCFVNEEILRWVKL